MCHAACFSPSRRRSGLRRGVARNRMRTEAGKMPESLISPIRNGHGVSNDRFGLNDLPCKQAGSFKGSPHRQNPSIARTSTQIDQTSGRLPACVMPPRAKNREPRHPARFPTGRPSPSEPPALPPPACPDQLPAQLSAWIRHSRNAARAGHHCASS